jgi:tellurite resistance protein TehA-like permease
VAFIVGAFWIIHGVADIAVAAASGPVPGRGLKATGGLLSLAAGAIVMFWPGISLVLLLTVLGAWLVCYGAVLAVLAFRLRQSSAIPAPAALTTGNGRERPGTAGNGQSRSRRRHRAIAARREATPSFR